MSDFNDYLSDVFARTFEPITQAWEALAKNIQETHAIQEIFENSRQSYQRIFDTYAETLGPLINILSESRPDEVSKKISVIFENSLVPTLSSYHFEKITDAFFPVFTEALSNFLKDYNVGLNNEDDFVTVNKSVAKTYEFPDSVCIPIGNNRIKMPTSFLLELISLIISTVLSIIFAVVQSNAPQPEQVKQVQIEEAQLELQRAQNEMLHQLLHNIDVSLSSEAESIKELQESVEELHKHYLQIQDTCAPVEESTDNSKSTEDTDTQEK